MEYTYKSENGQLNKSPSRVPKWQNPAVKQGRKKKTDECLRNKPTDSSGNPHNKLRESISSQREKRGSDGDKPESYATPKGEAESPCMGVEEQTYMVGYR